MAHGARRAGHAVVRGGTATTGRGRATPAARHAGPRCSGRAVWSALLGPRCLVRTAAPRPSAPPPRPGRSDHRRRRLRRDADAVRRPHRPPGRPGPDGRRRRLSPARVLRRRPRHGRRGHRRPCAGARCGPAHRAPRGTRETRRGQRVAPGRAAFGPRQRGRPARRAGHPWLGPRAVPARPQGASWLGTPGILAAQPPSCSGKGAVWVTVRPETARVRVTYRRRRPVRSSGSAVTMARGSSRTT
ncbi:hypothetical protein SAMN02745830_05205 [Streptomyces sp. Amel2xC10]|nr:hypothetical protein SAMN02745830_05205 [Streptomyces sp. Amel2xC10]